MSNVPTQEDALRKIREFLEATTPEFINNLATRRGESWIGAVESRTKEFSALLAQPEVMIALGSEGEGVRRRFSGFQLKLFTMIRNFDRHLHNSSRKRLELLREFRAILSASDILPL